MRAVVREVYGSPDVLRVEEVADPDPGPGDVVVRVRAASLNTADLDFLSGHPPATRIASGLRRPRHRILGFDVAGIVEAVGEEVTRLRPGDEVWADLIDRGGGAFAELVRGPETTFRPKPEGLTFAQAATLPHSATLALQALRPGGGVKAGDRVLVNGAGGCVGPFAIQIAKAAGAEVTGVDAADKLAFVRAAGADNATDYAEVDVTRAGRTYDRIVDIAVPRPVIAWRRVLAPGGTYAMIAPSLVRLLEASVLGGAISVVGSRHLGAFTWRSNDAADLALLGSMTLAGDIRPLIDRECALDEAPDALRDLASGVTRGKVVVVP
jgi:NADPH:quinone reductase-like Zn-dependent oxidoreductase